MILGSQVILLPKSEAIEQDPVWLLVKYCSMVPFFINGLGAVRRTPWRSKYRCPSVRITGSRSAGSAGSPGSLGVCQTCGLFARNATSAFGKTLWRVCGGIKAPVGMETRTSQVFPAKTCSWLRKTLGRFSGGIEGPAGMGIRTP